MEQDAQVAQWRGDWAGIADPLTRANFAEECQRLLAEQGFARTTSELFPEELLRNAGQNAAGNAGKKSHGNETGKPGQARRSKTPGPDGDPGWEPEEEADEASALRNSFGPWNETGAGGSATDEDEGLSEEEKKKRERFRASNQQRLRLALHDDGLGDRLARLCQEREVRFCAEMASDQGGRSGWLFYERGVYRLDDNKAIMRLARESAERIEFEEMGAHEGKDALALLAFAVQAKSTKARGAALQAAHVNERLQTWVAQLDSEHYALNLRNGTLDLRTGQLLEHSPARLLTKQLPFDYDPEAQCPRWLDFLLFAFGAPPADAREKLSDAQYEEQVGPAQEMVDFIARCVGYSLSGDTGAQVWFSCVGEGQNGKSTFFDVLRALCGDPANLVKLYAIDRAGGAYKPPPSSFCGSLPKEHLVRGQGNQSSERERMLYELRGTRLAIAVEMNLGEQADEAFLKQLTGGETVTARRLYQQPISYHPTFKVWLGTNYLPEMRAGGKATWRRVIPIPWDVVVPDEMRDLDLLEKLLEELPGILAWAVRGFADFWARRSAPRGTPERRDPLGLPPPVVALRRRYEEKSDLLGQFIAECLRFDSSFLGEAGEAVPLPHDCNVPLAEMNSVWKAWCAEQGIRHPMGRNKLARALEAPPYRLDYGRLHAGAFAFKGCQLADEWAAAASGGGK